MKHFGKIPWGKKLYFAIDDKLRYGRVFKPRMFKDRGVDYFYPHSGAGLLFPEIPLVTTNHFLVPPLPTTINRVLQNETLKS